MSWDERGNIKGPQGNPGSIDDQGLMPLTLGQDYVDVLLNQLQSTPNWLFIECAVVNNDDPNPLNIAVGSIMNKTATGFRRGLIGKPDSPNYFLRWAINGAAIPPTPAVTYQLLGPTEGQIGEPSTFTVKLLPGTTLAAPVLITPSDAIGDEFAGIFYPVDVTLSDTVRSYTFTYTPLSAGARNITTINDGGLTDPLPIVFNAVAGPISDGDTVLVWPDSSPSANHGLKIGNPIFKEAIVNGKPVVRLASLSDGFNLTTLISGAPQWSVYVVMKTALGKTLNTLNGSGVIAPSNVNSSGTDYLFNSDRDNYQFWVNASERGAFHVWEFLSYGGFVAGSTDGVNQSLITSAHVNTGDFTQLCSGEGDVAEIVFCATGLTGTPRFNALATLGAKYGISVAGGGTVIDLATLPSLTGWWKADAIV